MSIRKIEFAKDEYYHVFNRGTDGRAITTEDYDSDRFILSLQKFNTLKPIGSIYEESFTEKDKLKKEKVLVEIVAYCLNPNHFHLLLKQVVEGGVTKFIHRLLTGYSMYFNLKYKRKGALFQNKFGATHIQDEDYLLHASAYINLNDRVHQLGGKASKLVRSSWSAYIDPRRKPKWLQNAVVTDQFKSGHEYEKFAEESLELMRDHKLETQELRLFDEFE